MLASCAPCSTLTLSEAPFALSVVGFVEAAVAAEKFGLNGSALQLVTANGLEMPCVAPSVEVSSVSVESGPQLVGLNRNSLRLTTTLMSRRRSGTPLKIAGRSVVVAITRALCGSTLIVACVTTLPRSNGPAAAWIGIDRPYGAPA